jgi:copper ion binding protein
VTETLKSVILKSKQTNMKNLFFIALIAAFIAGCSGKSTSTDKTSEATATVVGEKTVTLAIEGMTCTGCENTVQEAVTKIDGVKSIKASHLDSTAVVSFDASKTSVEAIGAAVTEAGYEFKGEKAPAAPTEAK